MKALNRYPALARFLSDYGVIVALMVLCIFFTAVTVAEQYPEGKSGGAQLGETLVSDYGEGSRVLIVVRDTGGDGAFAEALADRLRSAEHQVVAVVKGEPADARRALGVAARAGGVDLIACTHVTSNWAVFQDLGVKFPPLAGAKVVFPQSYTWPNFLKMGNLLNIANQIAVIAIIAIGMTLVILTAGIDLSVGSLIALSAVVAALLIRDVGGATEAGAPAMILCCAVAIVTCAGVGALTGSMVTIFGIPPFIMTLGMMLVARGMAFILAEGQSNNQVPDSFIWLGRGADLFGIPNAVVLMGVLYAAAHILMSRMALGRYIYAVGGNPEAARLSGVPVKRVLLLVYTVCGALAGLGGIIMASQLSSGDPKYGGMYELYVIAAVVVGGTSLAGGQGKVLGTLIGAFIIAVIRNGMNLMGIDPYLQMVVLGLVIIAAVWLDSVKRGALPQS